MLELILIRNLLVIKYYNKYREFLNIRKEDKELYNMYNILDSLFETYKRTITFEEYKLSVLSKFPDYHDLINQIEVSNIGDDVLRDLIKQVVERSKAYKLALLSIDVSEGRKSMEEV